MKAWQIVAKDTVKLIEEVNPPMDAGDIKIKIVKAAISSTDLAILKGKSDKLPIIPVRSAVGMVSESNDLCGLKQGERVVINPYILDPDSIISKDKVIVSDVKVMGVDCDGLLRDFIVVPHEKVCFLPEGISDNEAIFTEYIALGIKVIEALDVDKGEYMVVLGANVLGNIIAQLALYYQIIPILVDTDATKLALAENYGVYYTINPTKCNVIDRVLEITGGEMAEYCVYEARNNLIPNYATAITKESGTIVVTGYNYFVEGLQINLGEILKKQQTLIGIKNGYGEIYSAINLLANKAIKTDGFIDLEIDFKDVPKKLKDMQTSGLSSAFQKVIVNC